MAMAYLAMFLTMGVLAAMQQNQQDPSRVKEIISMQARFLSGQFGLG